MIPLDTPVGSKIKHTYAGRTVLGTFVGFTDRGSVTILPDNRIQSYRNFSFEGQFCYHFDNANCYVVTLASPQNTQNKVLSRSLLLEKRFKEKQDAKKKKAVSVQDDESVSSTFTRSYNITLDNWYIQATAVTIPPGSTTGRAVNPQLGQLNGATWPFTG